MAINKHQITGRVGKKPELRFTPAGKEVTSFSLIHQPRRLNQQTQQWEDGEATWYDVTVFGRQANNVAESIDKGHEVSVVGNLKAGSYVAKDGTTKSTLEILADEVYIPLDHQIVTMVDKSAYGNKVSGGTGAPSNGGYNNYGGGQRSGGSYGGGFGGGGNDEEAPF